MKYSFNEVQKFTQWWLWALLIGSFSALLYSALINYGTFSFSNWSFFNKENGPIPFLILILIISLIYIIKLTTTIDDLGIRMRFFPFVTKNISWEEIDSLKILNYGFVGGWGIRSGTKYGTVYNIGGNEGIAIKLKNGKKFLIGTQKPLELKELVDSLEKNYLD